MLSGKLMQTHQTYLQSVRELTCVRCLCLYLHAFTIQKGQQNVLPACDQHMLPAAFFRGQCNSEVSIFGLVLWREASCLPTKHQVISHLRALKLLLKEKRNKHTTQNIQSSHKRLASQPGRRTKSGTTRPTQASMAKRPCFSSAWLEKFPEQVYHGLSIVLVSIYIERERANVWNTLR